MLSVVSSILISVINDDGNISDILEIDGDEQINTQKIFESSNFNGKRNNRCYFRCTITTTDCTFKDCFAFGVGLTFGSGGALYLSTSNLISKNTNYISNVANTGGSLSIVAGDAIISKNKFLNNEAIANGGAIHITASKHGIYTEIDEVNYSSADLKTIKPRISISEDTIFENNTCRSLGGALYIQAAFIMIENTKFILNTARFSGGAIYITNSQSNIIGCNFTSNKCQQKSEFAFKEKPYYNQQVFNGGGAICVNSNDGASGILTKSNYFNMNFINSSYFFAEKAGKDIHFNGNSKTEWISKNECHLSYNFYEFLVTYTEPLECYPQYPYIEYSAPVPEQVTPVSISYQKIAYDDKTDYTNNGTPTAEEDPYPAPIVTPKPIAIEKLEKFEKISFPPSRTPVRTEVSYDQPKTSYVSYTLSFVSTTLITKTVTNSFTMTTRLEDTEIIVFHTQVEVETLLPVNTVIETSIGIFVEETESNRARKSNIGLICGIAAAAFLLVVIGIVLVLIYLKRKNDDVDTTSSSSGQFIESGAIELHQIQSQTSCTVDNPLFTTTIDEDDPFKMDFSSSEEGGYFIHTTGTETQTYE